MNSFTLARRWVSRHRWLLLRTIALLLALVLLVWLLSSLYMEVFDSDSRSAGVFWSILFMTIVYLIRRYPEQARTLGNAVLAIARFIDHAVSEHMERSRERRRKRQMVEYYNQVIRCSSCQNMMTLGNFEERGGCPRCGSDLYNPTGRQAR